MTDARKGAGLVALLVLLVAAGGLFVLWPSTEPSAAGGARHDREAPRVARPTPPSLASREPAPNAPSPPQGGVSMRLTVPDLARVRDTPVPSAPGADSAPLRNGAMHVAGTGFPWQPNSNTYIAGHRLGFPGTPSDKLFWDLDELGRGDEIFLTDSDGRRYEYNVFRTRIVDPDDVSVAEPVKGRDVVSLQTCTLPDYSRRLVVQAELVRASGTGPEPNAPGGAPETAPEADPARAFGAAG